MIFRNIFRDMFYAIDCSRLVVRKDVSRVLVYGAGLRYRAFRRELVRSASANNRIIVGLLDDDVLLHGKYIGDVQVLGSIADASDIINRVNADAVVVACDLPDDRLRAVCALLAPTGVRVTTFTLGEKKISTTTEN
jgi:FlaA1/EpsC-like NDP-sugar epimerase